MSANLFQAIQLTHEILDGMQPLRNGKCLCLTPYRNWKYLCFEGFRDIEEARKQYLIFHLLIGLLYQIAKSHSKWIQLWKLSINIFDKYTLFFDKNNRVSWESILALRSTVRFEKIMIMIQYFLLWKQLLASVGRLKPFIILFSHTTIHENDVAYKHHKS